MQRTFSFLLGLALMTCSLTASAQTTPGSSPKKPPVPLPPRPKGAAAPTRKGYGAPLIKDTAAFRRSGRPADRVPVPARPIK